MRDPDITSVRNDRVKAAAALQRKKERDREGRYLAEGPNAVDEALRDGVVDEVFVTAELAGLYAELTVPTTVVSDHVLERIADSRSPQGVVAVARRSPAPLADVLGSGFVIALHEISDPGNAGTIVRTADAAGAAGVVFTTGSVDPWNPKAVRAASGSLTHLPVAVGAAVEELLAASAAAGMRVLALDAAGTLDAEAPETFDPPVVLLFGSEAHGLPDPVLDAVDGIVAIPRYGRAESLNLAAAVAVASYAAARRVHATA